LKPFSFTGLLKERCSPEKSVTFLYSQLTGTVSNDKCITSKSLATNTHLSQQHCSDSPSYGLTNFVSASVKDSLKVVSHSSDNVVVALKFYSSKDESQEIHNERETSASTLQKMGVKCVKQAPMQRNMDGYFIEECSDQNSNITETQRRSDLQLRVIKLSYNTYIPEITSTTVDCNHTVRKNTPSHSHVISLMEHIMEANGAMIFHSYMQSLKQKCKLYRYPEQQENTSFPTVPPSCLEHCFVKKFEGHCIMKTPVWAIHHCLSLMKSVKKTYLLIFLILLSFPK